MVNTCPKQVVSKLLQLSFAAVLVLISLAPAFAGRAKPARKQTQPARIEKHSRADSKGRNKTAAGSKSRALRNQRAPATIAQSRSKLSKVRKGPGASTRERLLTRDAKALSRDGKTRRTQAKRELALRPTPQPRGIGKRRQRQLEEARRRAEIARERAEAARLAAERQRQLDDELRESVQAMIARDNIRGEDPEIRRIAIEALGNHAGTVVVMDPKTGRVYSIVNQEWALQTGFKPCSTIKLVTGLAGLSERVIDPLGTVTVSSSSMNLTSALAHSNNPYFQNVGGQVGFNKMVSYARQFGLGEKTGINLPNESRGSLPQMKSGFALNRMSSHGDDFKVTALQLATLVSAMANGGNLLTPQVPRSPGEELKTKSTLRRQIRLDREVWQSMVPGMVGAVNYGTARRAFNSAEVVVGKTGTCIEGGSWVGLFVSYAPLNDPKLAVVVIARGTDGRNHFPVAVAGRIYRGLNNRFERNSLTPFAAVRPASQTLDSQVAADSEETTDGDNEELDALEDAATAGGSAPREASKRPWTPAAQGNNKVKRVLMTVPKHD